MIVRIHNIIFFSLGKVFTIYLLLFSMPYSTQAQHPKNLEDSVRYFINLSNENWHKNIKYSSEIARKNYYLSLSIDNPTLKADAASQYGIAFYSNSQYDSALFYYDEAIQIASKNQINPTPYLRYKLSVLGKKSQYLEIIRLIDAYGEKVDSVNIDLLITQVNAALEIGFAIKADSIFQVIDRINKTEVNQISAQQINKLKAAYLSKKGNYASSDSILLSLKKEYLKDNNYLDAAEVYLLLSENAMDISNYTLSMENLQEANTLYEKVQYEYGLAHVLLLEGTLYSYLNEYTTATQILFEALKYFEKNQNLNKIQRIYYEIGWIYYRQNIVSKANLYLKKSIDISTKIQNFGYLGAAYNTKGSINLKLNELDSAIYFFDQSIHYYHETKNIKSIAAALFNKAIALEGLGLKNEALDIYRKTYKIDVDIKNVLGIAYGELVLGKFFLNNGLIDSSYYYLNKANQRASVLSDNALLLDLKMSLANLYTAKQEFKLANGYLKEALKLQENILSVTKDSKIMEIETIYDLKNKEKELAYLNAEKASSDKLIALNSQKIKSQRQSLIALTVGLILLVILIYIIFKYTQIKLKTNKKLKKLYSEIQEKQEEIVAQSEELQESNAHISEINNFLEKKVMERTQDMRKAHAELDKFFYRASHDFRGPLTTMMGLVEVSKLTTSDPNINLLFNNVNLTAKKLDKMVRKLQSVSFLSDFQELPQPQSVNLKQLLKEITANFLNEYNVKELNFEITIKEEKPLIFYPNLLKICLTNLIENSIIFNKNDVIEISIIIDKKDDQVILTVSDNGVGIEEKWHKNIFEMFEKSSEISKGNGLGLYLVKKAVTKLNGEIKFESALNKGTKFILKFPLNINKINEHTEMVDITSKQ